MSARDKSLLVSALTYDGNNHLGDFLMLGFGAELATEDGRGGADAYEEHEEVKRKSSHDFEILLNNGSGARINAPAGVTVLNLNGDILADFESCTWDCRNSVQDGSGAASLDEFPNAVASAFSISHSRLIPASATTLAELDDMFSATAADRKMTCTMTWGGWEFSAPSIMTSAKHVISRGALDKLDCAFKSTGAPALTNPGGGTADIISVALEGDAIISIAATTGSRAYVGTGIITSLSGTVSNRTLVKLRGTIEVQGAWTKV
jgi:hypothetical protein